jgi:4-hydroxybenzoate polyprenyltransferase
MFEGLKWKSAARRSAIVIVIYLGLLYVLSRVFPGSNFNLDSRSQIISLLINATLFFFIFTFVYALIERSRDRRMSQASKQKKSGKPSQNAGDAEDDASSLKGRPNPNTSRKKSRRRR